MNQKVWSYKQGHLLEENNSKTAISAEGMCNFTVEEVSFIISS